jgi:hypothetical protein
MPLPRLPRPPRGATATGVYHCPPPHPLLPGMSVSRNSYQSQVVIELTPILVVKPRNVRRPRSRIEQLEEMVCLGRNLGSELELKLKLSAMDIASEEEEAEEGNML